MKTVMRGALALVLLASAAPAAFAQEDGGEHRRANRDDGGYNPAMRASTRNNPDNARPAPQPSAPAPAPAAPVAQAPAPGGQSWQGGDRHRGQQPPPTTTQPDRRGGGSTTWQGSGQRQGQGWQGQGWQSQPNDRRHDDRNDRNGRNDGDRNWGNQGWNNGGDRNWRSDRQPRPRYDQRHYGQTYRSQQRYRGYAYRPPSGFYIRSWSYGDLLPRSWWGAQYRLNDWWSYGLPIPPIGYEYVRVGDDVLLVDMFSGRVVQVIYDVFW